MMSTYKWRMYFLRLLKQLPLAQETNNSLFVQDPSLIAQFISGKEYIRSD